MLRYLAGAGSALLLVAAGVFLFRGLATEEPPAPALARPQAVAAGDAAQPAALAPLPKIPEAPDRTREQKRFDRLDRDRNEAITQAEFFEPRRKMFARLDRDGNGALSFEEWAVRGMTRFAGADRDRSGALNRAEFETTRLKRVARPRCDCGPQRRQAAAAPAQGDPDDGDQ